MPKAPASSPAWFKWWAEKWYCSTLRRRHLRTATQRGIYREFWDICMSSPDPGAAVDSAGQPYSRTELAREIGCRPAQLDPVIDLLIAQGKLELCQSDVGAVSDQCWRSAGAVLRLCSSSVEKSLPDHWKYKRLRAVSSDGGEDKDAPNQSQRQSQNHKQQSGADDLEYLPPEKSGATVPEQHIILNHEWRKAYNNNPVPEKWYEVVSSWDLGWVKEHLTAANLKLCESAKAEFFGPNSFASWLRRRAKHIRSPGTKTEPPDPHTMFSYLKADEKATWMGKARQANPGAPPATLKNYAVQFWTEARRKQETP